MPLTGFFRSGAFFLHCILHKIRQILFCCTLLFSFCFPRCTFLFCTLFQIFFRHIDKKKKKAYLVLCNMLFPLKTEESASQSKGCDAKLQGPVIWQPTARYSLRVRESETLHLLVKMRRLPFRRASAQRVCKGSERCTAVWPVRRSFVLAEIERVFWGKLWKRSKKL